MSKKLRKQRSFIEVENFSFDYDSHTTDPLLKDINLSIGTQETILFVGPSGSGKSTLSLCLNGLYPDAVEGWKQGTVYYQSQDIESYEKGEVNKDIGVVFQDPESQFCMMTVENELAFTMENIQIPREEMKGRMIDVLQEVGLEYALYRSIHELSGGEKQRVALAAVLLLKPSLLILDEPTSHLDPMTRIHFINLIERLKASYDVSIVIIEHQLDDWMSLTDRVIALNKHGRIIADGAPGDVFYGQYTLLTDEGIHLPQVVNDVMAIEGEQPRKHRTLPITEQALAPFLLKQGKQTGAQNNRQDQDTRSASDIILRLENSHFSRKKENILHNMQLAIHEGEFLGIVGENGAGKSTLLHILAGILTPDSGSRTFLDVDYQAWQEQDLRKNMGFVFQNPEHQFITNTVYDELAFGMQLNGKSEQETTDRVDYLLTTFGLENHRWHNPFSLSGGQKRRLSVATMLEDTPQLLLFDEPTFGQDARTTEELMNMITHLRNKGTSIVFVTHDMDLIDRYCERVLVLDGGTVSFEGTPEALWKAQHVMTQAHLRRPYRVRLEDMMARVKATDEYADKGDHKHVKIY